MEVQNLTGHDISVFDQDGREEVIASIGEVRVASRTRNVEILKIGEMMVPLLEVTERSILDVPETNGLFIVSGLVAAFARRPDFIFPARQVRDTTGRVIGCRAFQKFRT
jgi:hypothetical protein